MPIANFNAIPITGPGDQIPVLSRYDPIWGFYTFRQLLENTFNDAQVYHSRAVFQIDGAFTCDAEEVDPDADPAGALIALTTKYEALEALFSAAGAAARPIDTADWFTATDARCIQLPTPIADKLGHRLHAIPLGLTLIEGQYALTLRYSATLGEPQVPSSILLVNGFALNDAQVQIDPPKPIVTRHRMVAGEGSMVNIRNYTQPTISVSGVMPSRAGELLSERAVALSQSLLAGFMELKRVRWSPTGLVVTTLYSNLPVDSPSVDIRPNDRGVSVSVKGLA